MAKKIAIVAGAALSAAIAAHEVNRAYCLFLGDDSQPEWPDAPEWQTASALAGVEFHLANPDAGPEASHNSWLKQKKADGWIFGDIKDPDKKTHPCMVPFDQLPKEQQLKDVLFRAIVHAVYPRATTDVTGAAALAADLTGRLEVVEVALKAANEEIEGLNVQLANAEIGAAGDVEIDARLAATEAALETANEEIAGLNAKIAAAEAATAKALSAAKVGKTEKAAKPRRFKPSSTSSPGEREELRDVIAAAERVEIAFLSGEREVAGLAPLLVQGDAWGATPNGLMLLEPVLLEGPAGGCTVDGFGLVLDGKPFAARQRIGGSIALAAGSSVKLAGDIII